MQWQVLSETIVTVVLLVKAMYAVNFSSIKCLSLGSYHTFPLLASKNEVVMPAQGAEEEKGPIHLLHVESRELMNWNVLQERAYCSLVIENGVKEVHVTVTVPRCGPLFIHLR